MPLITLKIPFLKKRGNMLSETQLNYMRMTAIQIMSYAADPERFLMSYGTQIESHPQFIKEGEFRQAALSVGWDQLVARYAELKAEALPGLTTAGMRMYFKMILQGKSREEIDIWFITGLNAERADHEAYQRYVIGGAYAPATEKGKEHLAAIQKAIKEAEENKGKSGWFGDMAAATGAAPGIAPTATGPVTEYAQLSQQIQALQVQMKINQDEIIALLKELDLK